MNVPQGDLEDGLADVGDLVFRGDPHEPVAFQTAIDGLHDGCRLGACDGVAAAFERLGAFGFVTQGDAGNPGQNALFLNRATIGQDTPGRSFQMHEIEEPEGGMELKRETG